MEARALYKRRGKIGLTGREKRKEVNKLNSKAKRDDLLASRRRIPLGELNKQGDTKVLSPSKPKEAKPKDRLERLKEWQQARNEAKSRAKEQKKPVFVVGQAVKSCTVESYVEKLSNIAISAKPKTSFSSKKAILCMSPKPARPTSKILPGKPKENNAVPPVVPIFGEKVVDKRVTKAQPAKNKEVPKTSCSQTTARRSARLATKQTTSSSSKVKSSRTTPTTRSSKPQNIRENSKDKVTKYGNVSASERTRNRKNPSEIMTKSGTVAGKVSTGKAKAKTARSKHTTELPVVLEEVQEDSTMSPLFLVQEEPIENRDQENIAYAAPSTPIKKSYKPVQPSPLLHSHSAREQRRETMYNTFVNEPAWIPGVSLPEATSEPNFEEVFSKAFSPFKFIAGSSSEAGIPYQFTFQMEAKLPERVDRDTELSTSVSTDLPEESDDSTSSSSNAPITDSASNVPTADTNYDSTSSSNPPTTDTENATTSESEGLSDGSSATTELGVASSILSPKNRSGRKSAKKKSHSRQRKSSTSSTKVVLNLESELNKADQHEGIDVSYFRKLHSDACDRLIQLCEQWEGKTAALEQEDDADIQNKEEVLGQIRTTICQAQLLMRQKLKQYIGLVDTAESQSGERVTTTEDLQGFWDMVYFQVEGLFKMFEALGEMEGNGWVLQPPSPKKAKLQKRKGKKRVTRKLANKSDEDKESSERLQAAREKREAERLRLKEMKMKARKAHSEEDEKENQCEENVGCQSTEKSPRKRTRNHGGDLGSEVKVKRRSMRLKNRSVFSPCPSGVSSPSISEREGAEFSSDCDIPTGLLVSL